MVLLDVMLPEISGFDLISRIGDIPVIFVTAKGELEDKLQGLSLGAEDYIVKPFEMLELIARVGVVLRRKKKSEKVFLLGNTKVGLEKRNVTVCGEEVILTPREYSLLEILILNKNIALSREKLLELAWGYDYVGETKTVDVHIQKLRKKLGWEKEIRTIVKKCFGMSSYNEIRSNGYEPIITLYCKTEEGDVIEISINQINKTVFAYDMDPITP